ncbi:MAG: hypothetical protein ACJAQ4_001151 [Cryomorphaceae bacterium]|jgi:hypothetical protein
MPNSTNMKKLFLLLVLGCVLSSATAGGGWTYVKGKGFVKLSQNAILSDQLFNPDGDIIDITTIGYYATSVYAEYGLTDKLTAIAYVPFFTRNTLNKTQFRFSGMEIPGDELNAFGDVDLSLQYGFYKSDTWVASVRVLFGLPTGEVSGGETGILQSGDGEFNQMIRFDVSRPISQNAWISVHAGLNNRTNDFSDEYRLGAEIGTKVWSNFLAIAKVDVVQSFFNGDADPSQGGTIFSNNTEFISPSLELAYEMKNEIGFSLSAAGAFAGKNILAAPNYGVGVYKKF